jgi:hypothetical protein
VAERNREAVAQGSGWPAHREERADGPG